MNRGEKRKVLSVKVEFDTQQIASAMKKMRLKVIITWRLY